MSTPDERLHQRLARGEEAALGELYDRFAPLVHGLAARILDDQEAAEQLTREVFAHLWTRPDAYRPEEGSLRAWLGALTHRRAVERLRHRHGGARVAERAAARGYQVVAALPEALREAAGRDPVRRTGGGERGGGYRMRLGLYLVAPEAGGGPHGHPGAVTATGAGRPAP
ncbi:sigma factor [Kitasatospora sp. NPDC059571]|uniref:sigma factor n=1 Tax=Kitasatospora sp. NPDC059571 TaxID=3346871 RepID=UPI0036A2B90E